MGQQSVGLPQLDHRRSTGRRRQTGRFGQDFRKDIVLEVYNEAGQKVLAYNIYRCWPSEFMALPEMDANATRSPFRR